MSCLLQTVGPFLNQLEFEKLLLTGTFKIMLTSAEIICQR